MTGSQIKHQDPNGLIRRHAFTGYFDVIDNNDLYRGAAGVGTAFVGAVDTVLTMTAGSNAAFGVLYPQSLLLTGDDFGTAGTWTYNFRIVGFDLDGYPVTEDIDLTVQTTPISKSSAFLYSWVTSITVQASTAGSGTQNGTPLLAIGHGVATVAGTAGKCRFPISAKVRSAGQIRGLTDPNGTPVTYTLDVTRHTLINAIGTTLVVGRYAVHYNAAYSIDL